MIENSNCVIIKSETLSNRRRCRISKFESSFESASLALFYKVQRGIPFTAGGYDQNRQYKYKFRFRFLVLS